MVAVKIYKIPVKVHVTLVDHGVVNNNMPFRDSDYKVYKGTFNPIEFRIRNNDRKPVSLIGRCVIINVINYYTEEVVLQKAVECIDRAKGEIRATFTPEETVLWETGYYKYSLLVNLEDGTNNLLSVDQNSTAVGFFEVLDGALPTIKDSVKISGDLFTPVNEIPPTLTPTSYVSCAIPGDATICEDDGLHTFVAYVTDFAGKLFVEGSLEESPTSENSDWFIINLTSFFKYHEFGNTPDVDDTFTGLEAFNFTASVKWVRFKYIPDSDNTGTFDQILYRH